MTEEGKKHDTLRDAYLARLGFFVIRIGGFRVTQNPLDVRNQMEAIVLRLREKPPLPEAGEGSLRTKVVVGSLNILMYVGD